MEHLSIESSNLQIVFILTIGLTLASLFGYLSLRLKLSPILGYLLSGYIVGPFSPGFVADIKTAEQLAEIGVILMMVGVGLHFKWEDLISVKKIAIPGAIGQTAITALITTAFIYSIGWSIETGVIIGLAVGVASTVVLVRQLSDNNIIHTSQGHIAVGWLIVEDILTVVALILLPMIGAISKGQAFSFGGLLFELILIFVKFALLTLVMFTLGRKLVVYVLVHVARSRSHELFTIALLALIFGIAMGSAWVFGTSLALGAFIAGMVIGQTDASQQASASALPLKDSFVVLFFLSVGMLFNPNAIFEHFYLFICLLAIILVVKPLAALAIVLLLRFPFKVALVVAVALAQIGEFSFILAEEAIKFDLLPDEGYDVIVACALISISINPLLFKAVDWMEAWVQKLQKHPPIEGAKRSEEITDRAIVVGYGPIGKNVAQHLEDMGFITTIIDRNIDTVSSLKKENHEAVYGDAGHLEILKDANILSSKLLIITAPEVQMTVSIVKAAKQLNPMIKILARVRFVGDKHFLQELDIDYICCEEQTIKEFNHRIAAFVEQYS